MFMDHDTTQILKHLTQTPMEEPPTSRGKHKHDLRPSHPFLDGLHLPHHTTPINTKAIPPVIDDQYFTLELNELAMHEARLEQIRSLIREKASLLEDLQNGIDRRTDATESAAPTPPPIVEAGDLSRPVERAMVTNALGFGRTVRFARLKSNLN